MKRGDVVSVCYDGKLGRSQRGVVTKTRNGHHIQVRFIPWASDDEQEVECWFRAHKDIWRKPQRKYFGGYLRSENALMTMMLGLPGDWYAVYKAKPCPAKS